MEPIPEIFAVRIGWRGRGGLGLFRAINHNNDTDTNNNPVVIISRLPHEDLFYNIIVTNQNNAWQRRSGVKQGGNIRTNFDWKYNGETLENEIENKRYPVLRVTPAAILPSLKAENFIPIVERAPRQPEEAVDIIHIPLPIPDPIPPMPIPQPVIQVPLRLPHNKYPIQDIPQHAIRYLLQGAVIMGETCPISNEDIDIDNGAITTCFHIFDRASIQRWLTMPNSRDKCPVCNASCNVYTLHAT